MHLHHVVAVSLIVLSAVYGYMRIGAVVFVLHDIPDIVGTAVKASLRSKNTALTLSAYSLLLPCWAYFRLYLLARLIGLIWALEVPILKPVFLGLLSSLWCLHLFWFVQLVLMGYRFYTKKSLPKDSSETEVTGLTLPASNSDSSISDDSSKKGL